MVNVEQLKSSVNRMSADVVRDAVNELRLDARVAEVLPLRRTPAGVPIASCVLAHESKQIEAGLSRDVMVEVQAVALGDELDLGAAAPAVVPQAHQLGDGVQAEAHVARTPDEAQRVHVGLAVLAVVAVGPGYGTQQTQCFVVAQHLG